MPVPRASDRGMFRFGSLTSAAMKVMLFQASAANNEPVWAMHIATNNPNIVAAATPGTIGVIPRGSRSAKLLCAASVFDPRTSAARIVSISPPLQAVKTFWTIFPVINSQRVHPHVKNAINRIPTSCVGDKVIA